jgi:two-component system phosphate regulon sensor histidine kinase PhoR
MEFYYVQNTRTNKTIVYSSGISSEDYSISPSLFDKNLVVKDSEILVQSALEVYNNNGIDKSAIQQSVIPDIKIEKSGNLDILDNAQFDFFFKDLASTMPLQERVSNLTVQKLIKKRIRRVRRKTKFEFAIYNGIATKVKSNEFKYDKEATYSIPVFTDNEGNEKYQLLVTFPHKKSFYFRVSQYNNLVDRFYVNYYYYVFFESIDTTKADF